jgi:hypothetical protein
MLVPLLQARTELKDDEAFAERFFGYGSSQTIKADLSGQDSSSIARADQVLHSCGQAFVDLTYKDDGRMMIAIDDEKPDDRQCRMAIRSYSDTTKELDCAVPVERLAIWNTWKDPDGPYVSEIEEYCKVISSFNGSIEPT